MRSLALLSAPLILVTVLNGCGGAEGSAGPVVRDSAGVTIVENSGSRWPEGVGWRLSEQPILDIGVVEGDPEYQLYDVVGAIELDDERLVVANSGTAELRFFDADGRFLSASGRKGGGPGEFEDLTWIRRAAGDSLLAYDWRSRHVSVFDDRGNFVRSFGLRVLDQRGGFPVYAGVFSDGTMLLATDMSFARDQIIEGATRDSAMYYRCGSDGSVIDTIGVFPGGEAYRKQVSDGWMVSGVVFGKFGQAAVLEDGFYFGSSERYEIGHYDMSGTLLRVIRLDQANLPVTQNDIDTFVSNRMADAQDEGRRQMLQTLYEDMPFPDDMPAYGRLIVDAESNLWVSETLRPGDEQPRWKIFDANGAFLGTIQTPPRFRIYQIGSDSVLGRWRDEFDVEHIRVYELLKS
jgi:hypothetical protein